ncbi:MAG: glycosyltransferase family 4 protein [Chloroflexi bacterium]|nr:glycosyltransferase family 4 protein [Chloroflexota bacterium]
MTVSDAGRVRRLVVLDPMGNPGGGSRFVRRLLPAMREVRPDMSIRFVGNPLSIAREGIRGELAAAGIDVRPLEWAPNIPWKSRPLRSRLGFRFRRRIDPRNWDLASATQRRMTQELQTATAACDIAYFSWPYWLRAPRLSRPMVTTVHDLNYRYFFGTPVFSHADALELDAQIDGWIRAATAVASSDFMAAEIAAHYPGRRPVQVVRLAPFAAATSEIDASSNTRTFGRYIICPTHLTVHKNLGPLIAAHAILGRRYPGLKLVITGVGTEAATGRATPIGSTRSGDDPDVVGLGYVTNREIDALIAGAAVAVNPSLYEAGNGPGLDAWSLGTPVAMSDIPAFREHLTEQGVEAMLFDPRSPDDIAAKIASILDAPEEWAMAAARSQAIVEKRTWEHVAAEYLAVFDQAFRKGPDG